MKTMLFFIFLNPLFATAQSIADWNMKTDSLVATLPSGGDQMRFNYISDRRNSINFEELSDTSVCFVRIQEMFNVSTMESKEYIDTFFSEEEVSNLKWNYLPIDSLKPASYFMYLGCLVRPRLTARAKRWERKIAKMEPVNDNVYMIDTLWDKKKRTIKISLRIPVSAKRDFEAFYGDGGRGRKPILYKWGDYRY